MDPNISPSGQQPDDQSQTATATAEPPQQQQPQAQQVTGPFSAYLDPSQTREPTHTASQQRPSGFMGPAGKMAFIADQLLAGVAKGRADAYNRSIKQQAVTYKRLDQAAQDIQNNPALTDEDRQSLLNKIYQFKAAAVAGATDPNAGQGEGGKKKGKKQDGQDQQNPVIKFIHEAATRLAGPGAQPQQITPQSVNQVLGEVYSGMSQKIGAKKQLGDAQAEVYAAIGAATKNGAKSEGEVMADPAFQNAVKKYAPLAGEKGKDWLSTTLKNAMAQQKSTGAWQERLPDGTTRTVTQKDGVFYYQDGSPVPDTSPIERIGAAAKPKEPTEKQIELDRAYASWSKTLGKDKLDDGEKDIVAKLERNPDNPLSISVQAILNKQPKGAKNLQGAYDAAINLSDRERQTKIAESASNASLNAALKKLTLDDKKDKYNPRELDDVSRSIVNDVHGDGTPASEAEIARLRKSASDPKDPKRTESADALRKWAVGNVRDHPEFYQHLTDQQREQVIHHIDGMPVDKMVGRGGSAAAATTFNDPSKAKADASKSNGAAGAMRRTDAVPETKAEKTASNVPPGAIIPKATKPVTTESQLRADAKAKGMQTAAIDAMVKHYKDLGYVR